MLPENRLQTVLVCCSVFHAEVVALRNAHWPDLEVRQLSSMLHMYPERLAASLQPVVARELATHERVVLVYGDCAVQMARIARLPGVVRTQGHNCCSLLLGQDEYRLLQREGAFFLLPEWARRWREIFAVELGLNQVNATSLMREMHRKLVCLDTGLLPLQSAELEACSRYCGLPAEVRRVSLEPLRASIQEAIDRPLNDLTVQTDFTGLTGNELT